MNSTFSFIILDISIATGSRLKVESKPLGLPRWEQKIMFLEIFFNSSK